MRQEAVDRLEQKGIVCPDTLNLILTRGDIAASQTENRNLSKEERAAEKTYLDKLENEVRSLPESFFPPPEYEWSYSPTRVEELFAVKQIPKGKYKEYKDGKLQKLGDWQCSYCSYLKKGCLAAQKPSLAYMAYDFANLDENLEVQIGN
jgi:hypothetical protein